MEAFPSLQRFIMIWFLLFIPTNYYLLCTKWVTLHSGYWLRTHIYVNAVQFLVKSCTIFKDLRLVYVYCSVCKTLYTYLVQLSLLLGGQFKQQTTHIVTGIVTIRTYYYMELSLFIISEILCNFLLFGVLHVFLIAFN